MNDYPEIERLRKLMEEIGDLKKAKDLLFGVYIQDFLDRFLPEDLRYKIEDFFGHDDSE